MLLYERINPIKGGTMEYIMFGIVIGILVAAIGSAFCLDAKPEKLHNADWDVEWDLQ